MFSRLSTTFLNLFFVVLSLRIIAQPTAYLDYHTCRQMSTSILIFFANASFLAISQMSLSSALLGEHIESGIVNIIFIFYFIYTIRTICSRYSLLFSPQLLFTNYVKRFIA